MAKSPDAFRTISEVAEWLDKPAHVLRFWESKFTQVKPVKRAGGRRYYRPDDMLLLGGIKKLLHDDGMTIKGVQKVLREQGVKHVAALSQPLDEVTQAAQAPPPADDRDWKESPPPAETQVEEPKIVQFNRAEDEAPLEVTAEDAAGDVAPEQDADIPTPTTPVDAPAASDTAFGQPSAPTIDEPEAQETPDADEAFEAPPVPEPVAQDLPSFLRTDATPPTDAAERAPQSAPESPADPAPAPPPDLPSDATPPEPVIVDVPDVPPLDQIAAEPGMLTALLTRKRPLSADVRAQLSAARDDLHALRDRLTRSKRE